MKYLDSEYEVLFFLNYKFGGKIRNDKYLKNIKRKLEEKYGDYIE